jgi:hypothetical protein
MWLRHRVLPSWAMQAWEDPSALVVDPDPASRSGRSIRVIGYSSGAGAILVLILVRDEDQLVAASAWRANMSHQRRYIEGMDR